MVVVSSSSGKYGGGVIPTWHLLRFGCSSHQCHLAHCARTADFPLHGYAACSKYRALAPLDQTLNVVGRVLQEERQLLHNIRINPETLLTKF